MNDQPDAPPSPAGEAPPPPPGEAPPPPPGEAPPPPPGDSGSGGASFAARYGLVRPLHGRYLGGVCAAIGRATNTDPVLWRVLLAVTSILGVGLLIYLVGWLLIPGEGDTASPVEALLGRGRSRTSPVMVVVLGGLALLVLGFMLTNGFRGPLLIIAVVVGGVLLLSRNSERGQAPPPPRYAPPGTPEAATAQPPYDPPAAPYTDAAYASAYAAPPAGAGATAPTTTPGYRPPFAPRGPYPPPSPGAHPAPVFPPPPPPVAPPPPAPRERSRLGAFTLSLVLVAVGTMAAVDLANVVDVGAGGYLAAAVAMIGTGLVVGAWYGRARWLIGLGLVSAFGLGVASAAERVDTSRFGSDLVERPTTIAELHDEYKQNFGSAKLDLRQLDFTGYSKTVDFHIGAGDLEVILPPNVDTTVETRLNVGSARVFDKEWDGLRVPARAFTNLGADGPGGGQLRLNIKVNAGDVEVHR